ncbi:hypothetical protein I350_07983 [Cryptococcus amylolentus CBS 6273]|uniref:Uncharacterized protein n=1 Tax=Cryptococcus amylolentus CBS 6273 TaxID=1296118 RepID=A0A1E3J8K6_9TREE|nr:hypothetical protein I350_07983 [Cryptococcus amylolentus CBS 6273]
MGASASIPSGSTSGDTSVNVYIPPSSPLLTYSPGRNGVLGSSWLQVDGGSSECQGSSTFAVEVDALYFSDIAFFYSTSSSYTVKAGLDGSLSATSDQGVATLSTQSFGNHSARLECEGGDGGGTGGFQLTGVVVQTEVVESGTPNNATLDDASSQVTYTGFQSTSPSGSSIEAINEGSFYKDTISWTNAADATAAFSFTGSALYIFGMTGPDFGCFSITIDSSSYGTFNASTTISTSSILLFFTTYLDAGTEHQVEVKNVNDGMVLALDYFVAVAPQSSGSGSVSGSGGVGTATATGSGSGSSATAVFGDGQANSNSGPGGDSTAGIIGGILGGLAGLALIWLWWAYRRWKKAGGEGSFLAALCGKAKGKPAPPPPAEKKDWPLWPMMWSRPKYAV